MLTEQRKKFIDEYLKLRCNSQKQAAINAGYSPKSAETQASQIMKDPQVAEYLAQKKADVEQEIRKGFLFDAMDAREVLHGVLMDEGAKDSDRIAAAKDFLDRAGFKALDKVEHSGKVETGPSELASILEQLRGDSG